MKSHNLLYITNVDFAKDNGYPEKILGQLEAFSESFNEATLICKYKRQIVLMEQERDVITYRKLGFYDLLLEIKNRQFLYIRWPLLTPKILYILFLATLFQKCVIKEIPTFPFREELNDYTGFKYYYFVAAELVVRPLVDKIVYKYACIGNAPQNAPSKLIFFKNGIAHFRKPTLGYRAGQTFNFIFVGNFGRHYLRFGIDRFIEGLKINDFVDGVDIKLHIVGISQYDFCSKYKSTIPENVVFHGYKTGKDLTQLIGSMDCGVGLLGFHRVGIYEASPLKEKLYLSCGLPFVSSVRDNDVEDLINAKILVDANDEPINIRNLLAELVAREMSKLENKVKIYKYACDNMRWSKTMCEIMEAYSKYG